MMDYVLVSGRFLQRDPVGFAGGWNQYGYGGSVGIPIQPETNLYQYTLSDPVNFIDPQGESAGAIITGCVVIAAGIYATGKLHQAAVNQCINSQQQTSQAGINAARQSCLKSTPYNPVTNFNNLLFPPPAPNQNDSATQNNSQETPLSP